MKTILIIVACTVGAAWSQIPIPDGFLPKQKEAEFVNEKDCIMRVSSNHMSNLLELYYARQIPGQDIFEKHHNCDFNDRPCLRDKTRLQYKSDSLIKACSRPGRFDDTTPAFNPGAFTSKQECKKALDLWYEEKKKSLFNKYYEMLTNEQKRIYTEDGGTQNSSAVCYAIGSNKQAYKTTCSNEMEAAYYNHRWNMEKCPGGQK